MIFTLRLFFFRVLDLLSFSYSVFNVPAAVSLKTRRGASALSPKDSTRQALCHPFA
jgi:hypothetical protein